MQELYGKLKRKTPEHIANVEPLLAEGQVSLEGKVLDSQQAKQNNLQIIVN